MDKPVNIEDWRFKRQFLRDLRWMYAAIDEAMRMLKPFAHYAPVMAILRVLREERQSLTVHEERVRKEMHDES